MLKLHNTAWNPPITDPLPKTLVTRNLGYCGADQRNKKLAIDVSRISLKNIVLCLVSTWWEDRGPSQPGFRFT